MIPVIIGTRGSPLALAQSRLAMAALKKKWPQRNFELHIIKTQGDRLSENPATPGEPLEKGLFTAELERALFEGQIHLAIHSLKDLPTEVTPGFIIAGVPTRADARDVLITRGAATLAELPPGARIATGSPRRAAQLLRVRDDFEIVGIRGNIDTRLRKLRENAAWSGLILAAAGLERLKPSLSGLIATPLPLEVMLPAPGQGALALQTRTDAKDVIGLVKAIHDPVTWAEVSAERMFLHALGGGCREPVAAYARMMPERLLRLDGVAWLFGESEARHGHLVRNIEHPQRLGIELAAQVAR
jgi:hydroxymethylbilane synthase